MNGFDKRPGFLRPGENAIGESTERHAIPQTSRERAPFPPSPAWKGSQVKPADPYHEKSKRLVITATRKGGVGKSFFLSHLADWYETNQAGYAALDPDWVNGSLSRFLPNARFVDFSSEQVMEEITSAFRESDIVILDGMGPAQAYLFEWLKEADFLQNGDTPVAVTLALLIEEDKDCVYQAGEAAHSLERQVEWLVVRNLKTCSTTEIYDQSNARQELLRRGALEIQMERLPWNLLLLLQRASRTIGHLIDDESLTILERQRLRSYLARFFAQLESVRAALMPRSVRRIPAKPTAQDPLRAARPRIAPDQV